MFGSDNISRWSLSLTSAYTHTHTCAHANKHKQQHEKHPRVSQHKFRLEAINQSSIGSPVRTALTISQTRLVDTRAATIHGRIH